MLVMFVIDENTDTTEIWDPHVQLPAKGSAVEVVRGVDSRVVEAYHVVDVVPRLTYDHDGCVWGFAHVVRLAKGLPPARGETCDPASDWHLFDTGQPRCICGKMEALMSAPRRKK